MVDAVELLRTFNGNHIPDVLHHAEHILLTQGVAADIAKRLIGYVMAAAAEFYLPPHFGNGLAEQRYFGGILFNKVQYQAQGRFFTDAG